jgi:hypothetical protein
MLQQADEYMKDMMYEILIRRAFKYPQGHRQIGYWGNAFEKVKDKVEKAADKFLTKRLNDDERSAVLIIKEKLLKTYDKESLSLIVNELLEATRRYE